MNEESIFSVFKKLLSKRGYLITVILDTAIWSPMAAWSAFAIQFIQQKFYDGELNQRPAFILGVSVIVGGTYGIFGGWLLDKYIVHAKTKHGEKDPRTRINVTLKFFFLTYPPLLIITPILWNMNSEVLTWTLLQFWIFFACLNPYAQGHIWAARTEKGELSGTLAITLAILMMTVQNGILIWFTGELLDVTTPEWAFTIPGFYTPICVLIALVLYRIRLKKLAKIGNSPPQKDS